MKQKTNITSLPKRDSAEEKNDQSVVSSLSPREIVSELDRYVIGQNAAKRAVAIALRNRWRRQSLTGDMKDEVLPKNILMIGLIQFILLLFLQLFFLYIMQLYLIMLTLFLFSVLKLKILL